MYHRAHHYKNTSIYGRGCTIAHDSVHCQRSVHAYTCGHMRMCLQWRMRISIQITLQDYVHTLTSSYMYILLSSPKSTQQHHYQQKHSSTHHSTHKCRTTYVEEKHLKQLFMPHIMDSHSLRQWKCLEHQSQLGGQTQILKCEYNGAAVYHTCASVQRLAY